MSGRSRRPAEEETEWGPPRRPGAARRDALAVASFLSGPVAFALDLGASYFLVPRAHATGSKLPLHATTALAALLVLWGAWAALRVLRDPAARPGGEGGRAADRARFLALGGLLLCAFFLGALCAEAVPSVLLAPRD